MLVFVELAKEGVGKEPNPFKFNPSWLDEEEFVNIIK
jgi:hypothetical protein